MIDVSFRLFKKSDLHSVVELMHHTIQVCYPACYKQEVIDFFIDYHKPEEIIRKAKEGKILLAFTDNQLVATGYLVNTEIGGVYVHPNYQHKGIAQKVVEALIHEAKITNLNSVWLESTPIAVKLYKKLGFALDEECIMYVENNTPLPYFHMVKQLI